MLGKKEGIQGGGGGDAPSRYATGHYASPLPALLTCAPQKKAKVIIPVWHSGEWPPPLLEFWLGPLNYCPKGTKPLSQLKGPGLSQTIREVLAALKKGGVQPALGLGQSEDPALGTQSQLGLSVYGAPSHLSVVQQEEEQEQQQQRSLHLRDLLQRIAEKASFISPGLPPLMARRSASVTLPPAGVRQKSEVEEASDVTVQVNGPEQPFSLSVPCRMIRGQTLTGHRLDISSLSWDAGGKVLASSSLDNTIRLWAEDGAGVWQQTRKYELGEPPYHIAWQPMADQPVLVSSRLQLFIPREDHPQSSGAGNKGLISWSPCGTMLACSRESTDVEIWDVCQPCVICEDSIISKKEPHTSGLGWSCGGQLLATAGYGSTIRVGV